MDARFYNSDDIDIERLSKDLVGAYLAQGYQAQSIGNSDQVMVQLKKGGDFEAILGMQAALSLNLQRTSGGVLATIGQQRWIDKAAVGAVGVVALPFLWPLALTAGVGALRQASLGNQVLNIVDGLVRQQKPNIAVGPVPSHLAPQVQQQWAPANTPPPYYTPPTPQTPPPMQPAPMPSGGLRCSSCNTPYEAGDTFCSGCGKPLAQPHRYCSKCNSEIKPGVAFCPRCGSSTFYTGMQPQPLPQTPPTPAPTPKINYTPAVPVQPAYTPPPVQPKPTPPTPKPAEPYYVPSQQAAPIQQPKPQAPSYTPPTPPAKPAEPAYVPPATQTPNFVPQPKVTYSAGASSPADKKPAEPAKEPEVQYYVPSNQAGNAAPTPAAPQANPAAPQANPANPPVRRPAAPPPQGKLTASVPPKQPYYVPSTNVAKEQLEAAQARQPAQAETTPEPVVSKAWGKLTFSDGKEVQLTGDHAMVGRYEAEMGGVEPQVDLSQAAEADTVSRVHAVIEIARESVTVTDLNSTNLTRVNGKKLDPDKATPVQDGDTLQFGKVTCTFKKVS
jgi:hypothetical protein